LLTDTTAIVEGSGSSRIRFKCSSAVENETGTVAAGTAELNQALERAEENRKRIQARSLVIDRLIESGVMEDPAEMNALDSASNHDVEEELQALKRELQR